MECQNCGAEMRLHRRSDALQGEIAWYRCRRCDSGQMTSISTGVMPAIDTVESGGADGERPARGLLRRVADWLNR